MKGGKASSPPGPSLLKVPIAPGNPSFHPRSPSLLMKLSLSSQNLLFTETTSPHETPKLPGNAPTPREPSSHRTLLLLIEPPCPPEPPVHLLKDPQFFPHRTSISSQTPQLPKEIPNSPRKLLPLTEYPFPHGTPPIPHSPGSLHYTPH